ncbi:hypothetical protein NQ315_013048 [Exocentrus adspersus]|uniref:Mitochondrial basic amino acids transporter n=1 Tax=Exocentrus adspersus TaxID=1586481 RepID=A0AAV8VWB2_9CUCU|nr:hypothetical protein NQ315_013048 [Exocentrus adspersus]
MSTTSKALEEMALDFFAGCVGGMAGVIVGHPLDTIKVLLQTQDANNPRYRGTMHCLQSVISKQGFRGIYRGVTSPLFGVAGINAIVFGVHGNVQRRASNPESLATHAFAGAAAGLAQSFICSPVELAKSRLQISDSSGKGPVDCLRKIYALEGIKGVFRGLGITAGREIPAFATYFFTYELLTRSENNLPISTWSMLLAGGFAGVASWTVTYPIDTIKSKMQVDGALSSTTQYKNSYDCLKQTLKSGGVPSLFRGLTPTILRAFPVNAVTFTVVTWTMRILNGEGLSETVRETESILERYTDVVCTLNVTENSPT